MATAVALPALLHWDVHVRWWPPLHGVWWPRLGWASPIALVICALACWWLPRFTQQASWPRVLAGIYVTTLAWFLALGLIDGWSGLAAVFDHRYEYLPTAREIPSFPSALSEYVDRIPYDHPKNWQVHTAGHPPAAVGFFVLLVRVGITDSATVALIVTALAATTPLAVIGALRVFGAPEVARRAAPFLTLGPAAIWMCVSGDALFAAVAAWGLFLLAYAAVHRSVGISLGAGAVLGLCVMLSYGLILLGVLALTVLWLAGSWRPLLPAIGAALVPVVGFGLFGFWWWDGLFALHGRYWDGVASNRPPSYWLWGNFAALGFSVGPIALAAAVTALCSRTQWRTPAVGLALAAFATLVLADLSQMSRAEVERIWLPFVPWLTLGIMALPIRWDRALLITQGVFALLLTHLVWTDW
jgi:methylthioxylose transferase